MIDFNDILYQLGIFDVRYQGVFNTWTNKQPSQPIAKKLDRQLVNQAWVSSFPNSSATFLANDFSDHTPCTLDLATPLPVAGTKPYKFFNYLTKHPKFLSTVEDAWIIAGSAVTVLGDLCWKLKQIKSALKTLNNAIFSKIQERVLIANRLLNEVQVRVLQTPTQEWFAKGNQIQEKLDFLRGIEEAYFRQKSRINWLKEGDLNTSYFHRIWKVRTACNSIRFFILSSGESISDPLAMGLIAVNHFRSILGPSAQPHSISTPNWFRSLTAF